MTIGYFTESFIYIQFYVYEYYAYKLNNYPLSVPEKAQSNAQQQLQSNMILAVG
jgi:hypothetical protein